jgi:hypothetical protein
MADLVQRSSVGGQYGATAAENTALAVSNTAGMLVSIFTIGNMPAALSLYDNSSGAGGDKIFTIPGSTAIGTIYELNAPVANGIYSGGTTNTPSIRINYFKNGVSGK